MSPWASHRTFRASFPLRDIKYENTVILLSSEVAGYGGGSDCKQAWKVDRKSVHLKY